MVGVVEMFSVAGGGVAVCSDVRSFAGGQLVGAPVLDVLQQLKLPASEHLEQVLHVREPCALREMGVSAGGLAADVQAYGGGWWRRVGLIDH